MTASFRSRLALLIASAAVFIATSTVVAEAVDPRLSECGSEIPGNKVAAAFDIPSASTIWNYLPMLGTTPELADDDRPAYVVVFDGEYQTMTVGVPGLEPPILQNAVCVITADGQPNIYYNVSRLGFQGP